MLNNIIDRLNQRIAVGNIFDKIYGLTELVESDSGKKWATYIGNGQLQHVTGFDAQQGTLFWGKRGRFNINRVDSFRTAGCQVAYDTRMLLTAYAVVRKSHLPCDSSDAADWVASRIYKLISGFDPQFKTALKVVAYEVIPSGYTSDIRSLPDNFEYAKVAVDIDVSVITQSSDACYDICETGDIPLPDFEPCTPCLTEVAVDGVTITGNGTTDDPLVAIGGGGGGGVESVSGNLVDNTDPLNPIVNAAVSSDSGNDLILGSDGLPFYQDTAGSFVESVSGNLVDNTDPLNPIVDAAVSSDAGNDLTLGSDGLPFYQDSGTGGTVTSVSASVPNPTNPAFSVNVTDPTTTPSVDITANGLVTQYVRGDGSLANFPASTGGGASVSYYLNGSINQGTFGGATYYEMNRVPVIGSGTDFQRTNAQGDGYIAQFITDAGDPNLLSIPSGNWNFEIYLSASSGGGSPAFYLELYKYDGTIFTLIADNSLNPKPITSGTTIDTYLTNIAVPQTSLLSTDRLAVRVFVITSGRTITIHTEDNNLCQVITTFTTGLTALNGLTDQVQSFATGTAGTDFGISSALGVHTFNLPTASAINRGALSSADWSTFNNKFNTPNGTTSQYVRGDGSLANIDDIGYNTFLYEFYNY